MHRFLRGTACLVSASLAAAVILLAIDWLWCLPEGLKAEYVGRSSCAECHQRECDLYAGCDHDRAMEPANSQTVLGDFNNRQYTHFAVTSKMTRQGDEFAMTTDGPDGRMQTYTIKFTFGYRPLQQYLVDTEGGRMQCLPLAWDTEGKRWFHLYPDEPIPHTDQLHWTRPLQNWNYMCADCHSTNLQRNYDLKTNTYHTTWSEIDVSCEACHGPASLHVQLARSRRFLWDRRYGYGLPRLKIDDSQVQIDTCAPCHTRRRIVAPGFLPGEKFLDYYMPELLDDGTIYYADGQILGEDYEYGSFLQSRMYRMNVRCSDCHDPHSLRVKFKDGPTIRDNRLCGQCHVPATYDGPAHHHHPDASKPGTLCIECHMPKTTYMVVDPRLDHSIRIPRPDLTVSLGIPNACNGCHHDEKKGETPAWAEARVQEWYGPRKSPPHFAHAFAAGRQGRSDAIVPLDAVTRRKDLNPIVRASALVLLGHFGSAAAQPAASEGLSDPSELVRAAAVRSLQDLPPDSAVALLAPLLRDPIRAVRCEAARTLSAAPRQSLRQSDLPAFDAALAEYMAGLEAVNDQPAAHLSMAVVQANLGDTAQAEASYQTALRIDPAFSPARINLAMLYDRMGKKVEAERQFQEVIKLEPKAGQVHYSLGLLLAEDPARLPEALKSLTTAAELLPDNSRVHYNLALALQHLGKADEAEQAFKKAFQLAPGSVDILYALTILYVQQERWPRAVACAEELVRLQPNQRQFQSLLEQARRQSKAVE